MSFYHGDELSVTLFEESGDALFLFDPDTEDLIDVNPMAQRLSGFSRPELLLMQINYLFRSEVPGGVQRLRHAYKKTGIFHSQEGFLLRHSKDGVWILVNLTVTRLHGEEKTLGLVTARDVREHREMYAQLKKTEAELRRVLASVSDGVWSAEIDSAGRRTYPFYSPVVEKITGHSAESLRASPERWLSMIHSEDRQRVEKALAQVATCNPDLCELEYRIARPDGTERWVRDSVRASKGADGCSVRLDGVVTDITERKQVEQALRTSEERFRTLVEKSSDAVALLDATGQVIYASPSTRSVLGYTPEGFVGRNALEAIHPDDVPRIQELFARCLAEPGVDISAVLRYQHKDGTWLYIEGSGNNHLDDPAVGAIVANYRDISTRVRAEEALRESEARYRTLAESSSVGIWQVALDGRTIYANPAMCAILEINHPEELNRGTYHSFFAADGLAALEREQSERQAGIASSYEAQVIGNCGGRRDVVISGAPLFGPDGVLSSFIGTFLDITERKHAEEELARERDLLHILMDNIPHAIYFKDRASRYTRINRAEMGVLGVRDAQEAIGKTDFDYYPQELAREFFADEQRILQSGRPLIDKVEPQTGVEATERWLSSTKVPVFAKDGQPLGIVGVSRDITESRRAEEAMRASEAKYRSLVDNLPQGIFLKDRDLRLVAVNRHLCQWVGLPESAIVGKTDFDFFAADVVERHLAEDLQVLSEGLRLETEEHVQIAGRAIHLRILKTPVKDAQDGIAGVLGIFWDVTEQRALEAQLRQAQKMEAVGQLAGGVAHDFNNLLTVILGNVSLLQAGLLPADPDTDLLKATEKAAVRAAELTSKLLGFSRRTALRLEPVNLNACIDETLVLLRRAFDPRIHLVSNKTAAPWLVPADFGQMNQVLMNLCLNARDAMPAGGTLSLETANVSLNEENVRLQLDAREGEFVRLRVRDSGHGIQPDILPRIFEPFFTTKTPGKGTGLGLAMVFGIVKQHGGWITCTSQVGMSTCFDIYLPRNTSRDVAGAIAVSNGAPRHGTETILLVDDEPMIRNLGQMILHSFGYQVLLAEDGVQALEIYQQEKGSIALVILDLTMPRLSGRDTLRQLLQLDPQVRVLFASGYSAEHITEQEHTHVLGFIGKPYRPDEFAYTVRAVLDRRSGEPVSLAAGV